MRTADECVCERVRRWVLEGGEAGEGVPCSRLHARGSGSVSAAGLQLYLPGQRVEASGGPAGTPSSPGSKGPSPAQPGEEWVRRARWQLEIKLGDFSSHFFQVGSLFARRERGHLSCSLGPLSPAQASWGSGTSGAELVGSPGSRQGHLADPSASRPPEPS